MDKSDLIKQFANRLRDAMIAAGLNSPRSTSGVCIHQLAEITGYSVQICRRYLRGEAIPEPTKLVEIAERLNVLPGWLLFGNGTAESVSKEAIVISKSLLHYIFNCAANLYSDSHKKNEISEFLLELVIDVSKINASEEQSKKIIDLALSSIKHFAL